MTMFEQQSRQFAEQGFAVFPGVLAGAPLELLRRECDAFVAREDARMDELGVDTIGISHRGKRYFANECQRVAPELRSVLFSDTIAEVCRTALGPNAYFFFDQYVVKGPEGGLPFSWHQDSGYVVGNGGPPDHAPYLTCWCPLDDATEENGTVRLIPGSHQGGIIPHDRQSGTNDLVGAPAGTQGVIVEAKAGDVVAFSSLTLHATGANRSERPRRVYLAQYTPEAMLDPGTKHLRRNAIAFLRNGERVTAG
jgi:ectoine hydroxylase-related dioxygenase (phytanoyl-CoA dioxygenase family)